MRLGTDGETPRSSQEKKKGGGGPVFIQQYSQLRACTEYLPKHQGRVQGVAASGTAPLSKLTSGNLLSEWRDTTIRDYGR